MNSRFLFTLLFAFLPLIASSQAKLRRMPPNLNHPAINNFAPYISLDGNSMVYIADVGEDNRLTMNYTTRTGVNWIDPVTLPKIVNGRLNFLKGFALSPDGKTLYLSTMKSNGMGGFDIYSSQLTGSRWEEPVNMLLPINSKGHDACPSISLDGSMMFYMRCEKMDFEKAESCRIMLMKKKPNGQWDTPEELPGYINTGNSQTPRIMGDGEILIFSSDRLTPNKGGMDLYLTRLANGIWSQPVPLEFANTPEDDQYVSATSAGMYIVKDARGMRSNELVEMLFPSELRPKGTLKLEGKIAGPTDLTSPFVTVFNLDNQSKVFTTRPNSEGAFVAYMNYGSRYDLSIEPSADNISFFSKVYDLRGENIPMLERIEATLLPVTQGTVIDLEGVQFKEGSSTISPSSAQELRRLVRLIQGNPERSFSIEVTLLGYRRDSLRADTDLSETAYDSIRIPITYQLDSVTTATRDSIAVKPWYHNDRTLGQARAIASALLNEGISSGRMASSGKALEEALPEKRKTMVQIIAH
jgi:outer membrane protein OmpA-like peptidoglycan-associated protein